VVAAVHQPNYLPWLGFFHKLRHCDVFILLDDVQFPRHQGQGNWINRSRINVNGSPTWLSVPIQRPSGVQMVGDVRFADHSWSSRHRRTLEVSYRKAPHFDAMTTLLDGLYAPGEDTLMAFNLRAISLVLDRLGAGDTSKIVMASTYGVASSGTDRLVDLVKAVGATTYMTGRGAGEYLEPEKFAAASIALTVQEFVEVPRPQLRTREFVPGLSILDALLMVGVAETNALLGTLDRR